MRKQSVLEEKLNAITHAIGALLGIVGLILLLLQNSHKTNWSLFSILVYGLSIIVLFTVSTFYHATTSEDRKYTFRILDHISIYFLIAGTYTPVLLIVLPNSLGWHLFWAVWGIAFFGGFLKIFFTGKFETISVVLYLVMGWLILFDLSALQEMMSFNGIVLLALGGLAYTGGIVFYAIEKIPYNHVIWHLFVLAGAMFHFFMVLLFVV
ncbi:MAG: PAQR family membrane homeostasis protein TrhA [Oceanihabitans sp.]